MEDGHEAWEPQSFEEFKAGIPRHPTRPEIFLLEGDLKYSEEMLRELYDELYQAESGAKPRAWVDTATGTNNYPIYDVSRKMRLTYCVNSAEFGADHAFVVDALHRTITDWERAADVNFIYDPSQDGNCIHTNTNVWFRVRKVADPNPASIVCQMTSFGPETLLGFHDLEIFEDELTQPACAGLFDGHLRHELGHALGFNHEHIRSPNTPAYNPNIPNQGTCVRTSIDDFMLLTRLDLSEVDQASVMYYASCADDIGNHKFLTRRDAAAASTLYNLPKSGWLRTSNGVAVPQWNDYDGNPGSDIFWYDPNGPESFVLGQPGGLVTTQASATQAPLARHKPLAGNFNNNSLADVLLYTQGKDAMGNPVPDETLLRDLNAAFAFSSTQSLTLQEALYVPLLGQFAAANSTDIFFAYPTSGGIEWYGGSAPFPPFIEKSFPIFHFPPITLWTIPVSGDFNGDGLTDIFFYHPDVDSSGAAGKSSYWQNQSSITFTTSQIDHTSAGIQGTNTSQFFYTLNVGDFDGNGVHDILWYAPTGAANNVVIWDNGPTLASATVFKTLSGVYKHFSADFNGDGRTDVFWFNQGSAPGDTDKVWLMNANLTHTEVSVDVGDHDFLPVLGDYDADGHADIYWWHPTGPDKVWISNGNGTFTDPQVAVDPAGYPVGYGLQ